MPSPLPQPLSSRHVAVIGAGAAGLVAARELRREGHKVVVFEKNNQVGGVWVYTPRVEPDPMGLDPARRIIHSSMYSSLRTNLPREVMGFMDYPFVAHPNREPRRFPGHEEVLEYLKEFAVCFGVEEVVRFETEVVSVEREVDCNNKKWKVKARKVNGGGGGVEVVGSLSDEVYDAVVVCNGHYTEPRVAEIPGISSWPGRQIHSHNYRTPDPFRDKVVILIGSSSSAVDISREIAGVAKEVHVASRSVASEMQEKQPGYDNMWLHSLIKSAHDDGSVAFWNGRVVVADIILHCTGYMYHFPFIETDSILTVNENRVGPLYKHVFPPGLAPWLSFVGLLFKVVPFPLFELQSKWIAGVLSGRIVLPTEEEMMDDVLAFYEELEASNVPLRYTHQLDLAQFEYDNWLAAQCGCPGVEEWRKQMFLETGKNRRIKPETYRDEWEDLDLVQQAYDDFAKYNIST